MTYDLTAQRIPRLRGAVVAGVAGLAFAAFAVAPAPAPAAPAPSTTAFALTPVGNTGSILLRGTPGRVLRGSVLVRNTSPRRITVRLQVADIRNASNGNADYVTEPIVRTGRWLRLRHRQVHLAPRAMQRVAFAVRIPRDARGGSHYGGIVGSDAREVAQARAQRRSRKRGFVISRITRQALPVTVRLPGPRHRDLSLRSVKIEVAPVGAALQLGLRPGGTELIRRAPITLRVLRGKRVVLRHTAVIGQLFAGSALNYRIPWVGEPSAGTYRVLGVIRPQGAPPVQIEESVTYTAEKAAALTRGTAQAAATPPAVAAMPDWVWLAFGGIAALVAVLLIALVRQRRRRPDRAAQALA